MAPKFAVWRVIEPNYLRDAGPDIKRVMRDLQDFLLEFRDNWT